ncbi:MAG: monooxygenase [Chloroflexota bacterium]|nr:monooxygenase [Chloroflexota bacterium]
MELVGRHAVVLGGSIGGLLAARVLAERYDQVSIVERDALPLDGEHRKGVPQARHAHGLLARGREVLEELFPGFTDDLIARGALTGDNGVQVRWFNNGGYHRKVPSGLRGLGVSRSLLEARVRARVLALPNVRAIDGGDATGFTTTGDRRRVTGVRMQRGMPGAIEESLPTDLVVDASGRGSRAPAWLEALGYPRPAEEHVRYTTRLYRRRPEDLGGDLAIAITATPPTRRMGFILAQECDRWIVSLGGYLGEQAPTDEPGFLEFAGTLPVPDIYEVIREAEPLSEAAVYKFRSSQRRRYERLARFPDGLLVFGDAISSFNPIYGQGMTVAALEALALRTCLAEGPERLASRFFQRASAVVDIPWSIAVGGDLRFPEVEGRRSPMVRFVNWYMGKLQIAARQEAEPALAFLRVANLIAPPPSVLHPRVALRVLAGTLRTGPHAPGHPASARRVHDGSETVGDRADQGSLPRMPNSAK